MRHHPIAGALALALLLPPAAMAQDRVSVAKDPFDISSPNPQGVGEIEVTAGLVQERARNGAERGTTRLELQLETGIAENLELRFGQRGLHGRAAPRDSEETAPSWGGDTRFGLRWGVARENGPVPAVALIGELRTRTGESQPQYELATVLAVGKTLVEGERPFSAFVNLGWIAALAPEPGERPGRYTASLALGQHLTRDTVLVAAYVREQQDRDERDSSLLQAGFRHRLGEGLPTLGVAVGAGVGRDSPAWQLGAALVWTIGR